MKRTLLSLLIATTAATPMLANAASSAQLKVTGSIAPASCSIAMPGGATIDLGKIASDTLEKDDVTLLEPKSNKLQVSCDAPTLFAIKTTDERAGTNSFLSNDSYGLGTVGSIKIGYYIIQLTQAVADGKTVPVLRQSRAGSTSYEKNPGARLDRLMAFGAGNGLIPTAYKDLAVNIKLLPRIAQASTLPLNKEIKLDGLVTLELVYL
ncbi:DUF1120 domain-containing protein [Castellaniella ginsengisoli]|uniref:DUF1120 domain-containing protein n=1 Tax=Castellaniella ginsengisoli TaxID=546114 RepID=A0AB39CJR3_9BURK